MATFPFDRDRLVLPEGATDREAAAIAAAIERALAEEGPMTGAPSVDPWRRAARIEAVGHHLDPGARPATDPWRVAGRW
ncbi:MAG: hypothetical protein ACLFM8_08070 [Halobacteriales archaeon]